MIKLNDIEVSDYDLKTVSLTDVVVTVFSVELRGVILDDRFAIMDLNRANKYIKVELPGFSGLCSIVDMCVDAGNLIYLELEIKQDDEHEPPKPLIKVGDVVKIRTLASNPYLSDDEFMDLINSLF